MFGIERKHALLMDLPDGKRPGFYAQIVKALADKAPLFDRDKEMLIFSDEATRGHAEDIMRRYNIGYETLELLLLPPMTEMAPACSDFGFVSRAERIYAFAEQVSAFRIAGGGERAQAVRQMEEHLLARVGSSGDAVYVVETHLIELMAGIAKAYGCSIETESSGDRSD